MTERQARFRAIFEATRADVSGYVSRRTSDRHEAEDVLSETYGVVWRRLDDAPDGNGLRPWTFTIARNVLANVERARRRRWRLQERVVARGPDLVTVHPDSAGDREGITSAFVRLRPGDRDLLTMAGVEGLETAAMAQILGCSVATLQVRLHRARGRFRRELIDRGLQGLLLSPSKQRARQDPCPASSTRPEEAR